MKKKTKRLKRLTAKQILIELGACNPQRWAKSTWAASWEQANWTSRNWFVVKALYRLRQNNVAVYTECCTLLTAGLDSLSATHTGRWCSWVGGHNYPAHLNCFSHPSALRSVVNFELARDLVELLQLTGSFR